MNRFAGASLAAAIAVSHVLPAQAEQTMTARVFETLTPDQRTYYVGGIIHTLMLHTIIIDDGDNTRAKCINNWYFKGQGPVHVRAAFARFPDDDPAALVESLMRVECGKGKEKDSPNLKRHYGD